MAFVNKYLKYTSDNDKEIIVRLKMADTLQVVPPATASPTITQRLDRGDFTSTYVLTGGFCILRKRDVTMRYVDTVDYGRVYFRTHTKWKDYWKNNDNADNIIAVCGECYNCRGLAMVRD